ncbi:MAG TPA: hypothetical protein VFS54_11025 [Solirubrobacterales bacterium]|nr:hypothetical protein [Solirubrobacterales bacterium]
MSQLHELTVGGEVLSQRRAEQSFASFFEQSQTTLSLVNDTLELAKEANERATQSMDRRAKEQVAAIGEKGDDLLQRIFRDGDFEEIAYVPEYRAAVHGIGDELRAVEGLLRLQDIKLPRHLKFIKAIDQFLLDDTEGAHNVLRQISHEGSTGPLHHFILFWLGYMSTTVGDYEEAVRIFVEDETGLAADDTERFQLDCVIAETRFFDKAKRLREEKTEDSEGSDPDAPLARLHAVAPLLDDLTKLAYSIAISHDHRERHHVSLEVARTRADIYVWIAYDEDRINMPLESDVVAGARHRGLPELSGPSKGLVAGDVEQLDAEVVESTDEAKEEAARATRFSRSQEVEELSDDELRAWALTQAIGICEAQHDRNFDVNFALAESYFLAGDRKPAKEAFEHATVSIRSEFRDYLEQRRKVSLRQCELLCHQRLHLLTGDEQEARQVNLSTKAALEAAGAMRQERVTIFSQIQRLNLNRAEFIEEVERVAEHDAAGA